MISHAIGIVLPRAPLLSAAAVYRCLTVAACLGYVVFRLKRVAIPAGFPYLPGGFALLFPLEWKFGGIEGSTALKAGCAVAILVGLTTVGAPIFRSYIRGYGVGRARSRFQSSVPFRLPVRTQRRQTRIPVLSTGSRNARATLFLPVLLVLTGGLSVYLFDKVIPHVWFR